MTTKINYGGRPDLWTLGLLKSNKRLLKLKEKAKGRGK